MAQQSSAAERWAVQGVFYVDMRDASAVDMSVPIKEFCQNQNVGVPAPAPSNPPAYPLAFHKATQHDRDSEWQPRSVKMEDFTFNDLFLRVGLDGCLSSDCYLSSVHYLLRACNAAFTHAWAAAFVA